MSLTCKKMYSIGTRENFHRIEFFKTDGSPHNYDLNQKPSLPLPKICTPKQCQFTNSTVTYLA